MITGFCAIALAATLGPRCARAANQDEIEVYDDGIVKPGEFGLDVHVNGTPGRRAFPLYPGEITNNGGYRVSPELSYGLTKDVELGFYADTEQDGSGTEYFAGTKYRMKWLPVHPEEHGGLFAGANVEFSSVGQRFSQSPEGLELRLFDGYRSNDWLIAVNPIFDWGLSGTPAGAAPDFTAAVKITRKVAEGISAGIEYYGDIGNLDRIPGWNDQDHRIYAVADIDLKPFVFNIGAGIGLSRNADGFTVKTVWQVPLEEIFKR